MSTESFDPYHKWLGIRPEEQPANHYRLLALGLFEDDADAIANAADQRMLLVRSFQTGRSSAVSQKLLNEITAAKLCLLSPERKAAYDEQLRAELGAQTGREQRAGAAAPDDVASPQGGIGFPGIQADVGASPTARRSGPPPLLLAAGGFAALVLLGALVWIVARPGQADPAPTRIATRDAQEPVAPHQRLAVPKPPPPPRDVGEVALADATLADRSEEVGPPELPPGIDARPYAAHQREWAERLGLPIEQTNSIGMKFVLIPPGEYDMGSDSQEIEQLLQEARREDAPKTYLDRISTEAPQHRVRITRPFYLGVHQVTQAEYERVVGNNPSEFKGDPRRPVENVSWHDAVEFCRKLSELAPESSADRIYRLPTEAEWEYACRAGSTTRWHFGDDASELDHYAWHGGRPDAQPQPVGQKKPNGWGLYDMLGNVWEWCADWFHHDYYANSPVDDPPGPPSGKSRVVRGSSWDFLPYMCRSTHRVRYEPDRRSYNLGFRVAFTVDVAEQPESIAGRPHNDRPPAEEIPKPERQPVPASSEQQEVRRAIDDLYDAKATRKPEESLELADKLAALAEKSKDGTERFVLLRRASELASDAGDARRMLELVARIAGEFEVDRLSAEAAMLDGFAKKAAREEQIGALVEAAGGVIDRAMAAERFDLAESLAESVYRSCLPAGGRAFRVDALARRREVQEQRGRWEKVQTARAALQSNPDDEAAHTLVGRWTLLVQADWDRALPHLAKGSEAALRKLAGQELNNPPEDPTAQVELADAWWELAQAADAVTAPAGFARARYWYRQAEPEVTGSLLKAKVAQRLKELAGMELPTLQQAKRTPPPAVAPFDAQQAAQHQRTWGRYLGLPVEHGDSIGMKFSLVPPGEFMMGSPDTDTDADNKEKPQHRVRITRPFYLAIHEVTQAKYERVMGRNPSAFQGDPTRPVEQVSWHDAVEFCRRLGETEGRQYRLPTEAEWEYACRAGTTTRWHFGDDVSELDQYAWYRDNSDERTHPVGQKKPNAWGLHDMGGNVWEWCADWFDEEYYANSPTDDPAGPPSGSGPVRRGGCWIYAARGCRSAYRSGGRPPDTTVRYLGFRVVQVLAE